MPNEASIAIGLAMPLPGISGAAPCTGSNNDRRFLVLASISPSEADGSMPSEPVSIAAISDSMSPNRLSATLTEHPGFHHVALLHRSHLVAALARQIESDARDTLDFIGVIHLRIDGALLT